MDDNSARSGLEEVENDLLVLGNRQQGLEDLVQSFLDVDGTKLRRQLGLDLGRYQGRTAITGVVDVDGN